MTTQAYKDKRVRASSRRIEMMEERLRALAEEESALENDLESERAKLEWLKAMPVDEDEEEESSAGGLHLRPQEGADDDD